MTNRKGWLWALAALLALGAPRARAREDDAAPRPQATRAAAGDPDSVRLGGFAGYGASTTSGLALRGDGEIPFRPLGARLSVSWVGSIGFSRLTRGESGFGVTRSVTVTVLDVVPAARLTLALGDRVAAYADAGFGVYRAGTELRQVYAFDLGTTKVSSSELGTMMRFGSGVWVRATSRLDVGAGFDLEPHFGSQFGETTLVLHGGAMYRL